MHNAHPPTLAANTAADEQAIRDIVAALETAWNSGDSEAWSGHLAENVVHTVWNGRVVEGRDAITAAHSYLFDGVYKDTRQTFTVRWVRFLRPDVAAVQFDGTLTGKEDIPKVRPLAILTRQNGRWLIDIFQNTPILPQPGNGNSPN